MPPSMTDTQELENLQPVDPSYRITTDGRRVIDEQKTLEKMIERLNLFLRYFILDIKQRKSSRQMIFGSFVFGFVNTVFLIFNLMTLHHIAETAQIIEMRTGVTQYVVQQQRACSNGRASNPNHKKLANME